MRKRKQSHTIFAIAAFAATAFYAVQHVRGCNRQHARVPHDWAFDVSPSGDKIVFSAAGNGERDLYLLNLKTSGVTRLTNTPDYENDPAFSPDGRSIAYVAGVAATGDRADHLFIRSLDGKTVKQLTNEDFNDQSPAFSPDGQHIVFLRADEYVTGGLAPWGSWWNPQIFLIRRDGTQLRQITTSKQLFDSPQLTKQRQNLQDSSTDFNSVEGYDVGSPHFASNGRSIVFDVRDTRYGLQHDIATIDIPAPPNPNLMNFRLLTQDGASVLPCSSHDGRSIFFHSDNPDIGRYGRLQSLCRIRLDGTQRISLFPPVVHTSPAPSTFLLGTRPKASFDGKHLYFLAEGRGLWRMNINDKKIIQIAQQSLFSTPLQRLPHEKNTHE